jgi:hypothetical protein
MISNDQWSASQERYQCSGTVAAGDWKANLPASAQCTWRSSQAAPQLEVEAGQLRVTRSFAPRPGPNNLRQSQSGFALMPTPAARGDDLLCGSTVPPTWRSTQAGGACRWDRSTEYGPRSTALALQYGDWASSSSVCSGRWHYHARSAPAHDGPAAIVYEEHHAVVGLCPWSLSVVSVQAGTARSCCTRP